MSKKKKTLSFQQKGKKSEKVLKGLLSLPFILCAGAKWKMSIFHREIFMFVLAHGNAPVGFSFLACS